MEAKGEIGMLPSGIVEDYNRKIDDAVRFNRIVHEADCIPDAVARARELDGIGDEILRRNNMVLYSGVMNQAVPINREIGGRWFDEMGWTAKELESAQNISAGPHDGADQTGLTPGKAPTARGPRSGFLLQHGGQTDDI